jgi:hypothetical protein
MTKKYVFGVLLNISAIIFFFVPFAILFIIRYDSWVSTETTKISVGVMIGLGYAILVLRGALKQMSPKLTTIISMGVFLALLWFFDSILNDLFFIVFSVMIGYIFFIGLNSWGKRQIEIAKIYKDETVRVVARNVASSSTNINSI